MQTYTQEAHLADWYRQLLEVVNKQLVNQMLICNFLMENET
jgi:hypothetical protein